MIGDFFTKPVGGSKFRPFCNIIMNISHDEYGPVDVDALMAVHNEKMQKRIDAISQHVNEYDDEPTISKCYNTVTDVNSQEYVVWCLHLMIRYQHKKALMLYGPQLGAHTKYQRKISNVPKEIQMG